MRSFLDWHSSGFSAKEERRLKAKPQFSVPLKNRGIRVLGGGYRSAQVAKKAIGKKAAAILVEEAQGREDGASAVVACGQQPDND